MKLATAANGVSAGPAPTDKASYEYASPADAFHKNGCSEMFSHVNFHAVGENYTTDGYVTTAKTTHLFAEHKHAVGRLVVTRFQPEPNDILHISHAKAINIDFGFAQASGGVCYLRLDDTNPEKEDVRFVNEIIDMVNWLCYKPYKITHSSDYFDQLYEWVLVLIRKGLAYVCHQTVEDMRGFDSPPSPWRGRPVDEIEAYGGTPMVFTQRKRHEPQSLKKCLERQTKPTPMRTWIEKPPRTMDF